MAFLFLGLVLVAGYGAPVGVGVLVGLLLGAMAAVAFVAMASRRNGATTWYGFTSAGSSLSRTTMKEPDQDLIQRHGVDSMRVMGVDAGALRRVIPVGVDVVAGGARVELIAVELREHGGIATPRHPPTERAS